MSRCHKKVRNLTETEDKHPQWKKILINASTDLIPLLSVWLSVENEIPITDKVR